MSRWTLGLMLFCLQMGCASTVIDSPQSQTVGHYDILSTPLDYQHHVVYVQGDRHRLCHSPPRDALVGSSESIGLTGAGESVNASDGVTSTMASGRSDVTYISTEIMYRVCEFILNSNLSQEDATALFLIALEQVSDIGVAAAQNAPVRDPHDHGFTVQGDLTVPVEVQAEADTTGKSGQ